MFSPADLASPERASPQGRSPRGQVPEFYLGVVLGLAAFGPYVLPGVRTEQLAVYACATLLLAFASGRRVAKTFPPIYLFLLALWLLYVASATVSSLVDPPRLPQFIRGNFLAGVDNLLLPVAALLIPAMLHRRGQIPAFFRGLVGTVILATLANAMVSIISVQASLDAYLQPFWTTASEAGSVGERAAVMGRFSGIFNQPAEAGAMYSVAAVLVLMALKERPVLQGISLTLISVGGILSVSKLYLIVGLFTVSLWWLRHGKRKAWSFAVVVAATASLAYSGVLNHWVGLQYFLRLLRPDQSSSWLTLYTAGRLGQGSSVFDPIRVVASYDPLIGVGFQGIQIAYDNGWAEAFVMAGIVGVVVLSLVMALVAIAGFASRASHGGTLLALALIGVLGSVGIPLLTANRVASVYWLSVGSLILLAANRDLRARSAPR